MENFRLFDGETSNITNGIQHRTPAWFRARSKNEHVNLDAYNTWLRSIEAFAVHMRHHAGLTSQTTYHYKHDLLMFLNFLCEYQPSIEKPSLTTKATVQRFLAYSSAVRQNAPSTMRRRLVTLRRFFRFVHGESETNGYANPINRLKYIPGQPKTGDILTAAERKRLIAFSKTTNMPTRDHAIVQVFFTVGCKLGEFTGLNVDDFNELQATLTIRTRGPVRAIGLSAECRDAVAEYIRQRPVMAGQPALFLNTRADRITQNTLYEILKVIAHRAELKHKRVTFETLRNTCFAHLWLSGVSLTRIHQMSGNQNINRTRKLLREFVAGMARDEAPQADAVAENTSNADDYHSES